MNGAAPATREQAALMDRIYRRQRYIYDATRAWYLLGRDRLIAELEPEPGHAVLEIGCGTARNLIAAARRYPLARFYGIDISSQMLDWGRRSVARAGLCGRVILAEADATRLCPRATFGMQGFDRCFASYSLSMIPAWREAAHAALDALNQGGRLHIVDFGQCERLPAIFRSGLFAWLGAFHVSPRRELLRCLEEEIGSRRGAFRRRHLLRGYAWYATGALQPVDASARRRS